MLKITKRLKQFERTCEIENKTRMIMKNSTTYPTRFNIVDKYQETKKYRLAYIRSVGDHSAEH